MQIFKILFLFCFIHAEVPQKLNEDDIYSWMRSPKITALFKFMNKYQGDYEDHRIQEYSKKDNDAAIKSIMDLF